MRESGGYVSVSLVYLFLSEKVVLGQGSPSDNNDKQIDIKSPHKMSTTGSVGLAGLLASDSDLKPLRKIKSVNSKHRQAGPTR